MRVNEAERLIAAGHASAIGRRWALVTALLFVACSVAEPIAPVEARTLATPTPQIVYVTPSPAPTFNPKRFSVVAVAAPITDEEPNRIVENLRSNLSTAWALATSQRSLLVVNSGPASDVVVLVEAQTANQNALAWAFSSGRTRIMIVHAVDRATDAMYVRLVVHELGHSLGCCYGPGSDGTGHVMGCPTATTLFVDGVAIMCPHAGGAPTFNEYELTQMGL